MTGTPHRRPITSHPAFAPVIALWFAALLGLTLAVLPGAILERILAAAGLGALLPLTLAERVAVSALAAAAGALAGVALVRIFVRRTGDPRPIYAEAEHEFEHGIGETPIRRPLRVREEMAEDFGDETQVAPSGYGAAGSPEPTPVIFAAPAQQDHMGQESFMILTPQPIHPPLPAPDLDALLDQFDTAFAAFSAAEGSRTAAAERPGVDPVQAFVAQQTGVRAPESAPAASRPGGLVPDHQAELRAALDKLARSQRGE